MLKDQPDNRLFCLRCKTVELTALDSPKGISFFECAKCHRNFTLKPGGALCYRWMHPITLVLYPVIFEKNPAQHCERIAAMFAKEESVEGIKHIVDEIRLELNDPTQRVRDLLECAASEQDLRNFLRCVADGLESKGQSGSHHKSKKLFP